MQRDSVVPGPGAARIAGRPRLSAIRLALVVSTIPIAIFKNAIRISVIASLSAYVNRAFLYGRVHHYGGLVFTPLGVVLFVALLAGLQRYEAWEARHRQMRLVANPAAA